MESKTASVLKKDATRTVEACRLPTNGEAAAPGAPQQAAAVASARIIEQRSDAALIEVTCTCGRKITLQCDLTQ